MASQFLSRLQLRSARTRDEVIGVASLGATDAVSAQAE